MWLKQSEMLWPGPSGDQCGSRSSWQTEKSWTDQAVRVSGPLSTGTSTPYHGPECQGPRKQSQGPRPPYHRREPLVQASSLLGSAEATSSCPHFRIVNRAPVSATGVERVGDIRRVAPQLPQLRKDLSRSKRRDRGPGNARVGRTDLDHVTTILLPELDHDPYQARRVPYATVDLTAPLDWAGGRIGVQGCNWPPEDPWSQREEAEQHRRRVLSLLSTVSDTDAYTEGAVMQELTRFR